MMEKFGEYDPATPLGRTFCPRISVQQFEEEASAETHDALQSLMGFMEQNPQVYKKVLGRRKKDEAENAGFVSYLKSKVFEAIQGENYMENSLTEEETIDKLTDMHKEMSEVYDYAQEAKCSHRRFSKRLASKRGGKSQGITSPKVAKKMPQKPVRKNYPTPPPYPPPAIYNDNVTPLARPPIRGSLKSKKGQAPPPPPPPPPPPSGNFLQPKPLGERTNTINSPGGQRTPKSKPNTPKPKPANLKKLAQHGSNTGTPCHTPHIRQQTLTATPVCGKAVGNFGSECVIAFNSLMVDKFRNARSPPSALNSPASCSIGSPSGFTP